MPPFLPPTEIRSLLSRKKSLIYQNEVPLFGKLLEMIKDINAQVENDHPGTLEKTGLTQERLTEEIHGAIRLALPEELRTIAKGFAICGMYPANYYDLTVAGMPAHATAFRPIDREQLAKNPYRVFTSLLKLDILKEKIKEKLATMVNHPDELMPRLEKSWGIIEEILSKRSIFTAGYLEWLKVYEQQGGLTHDQAVSFVDEFLETFKWQKTAAVSKGIYDDLSGLYKIVGDVLGFKVPHINHLTPVTLDIDEAHARMHQEGMQSIKAIQGPPRRKAPILLRQTSFRALTENTLFPDKDGQFTEGGHTARFGEIEQRGIALTPKGRALYDLLLDAAIQYGPSEQAVHYAERYPQVLTQIFTLFPDDYATLRKDKLAFFYEKDFIPIIYEDFLPFSAVGIFKSNLGDMETLQGKDLNDTEIQKIIKELELSIQQLYTQFDEEGFYINLPEKSANQISFETALGKPVVDMFFSYKELQKITL